MEQINTTRTIVDVINPRWANSGNTVIVVDVIFEELSDEGYLPFSTSDNADTEHGQTIWDNAMNGDYGVIEAYIAPPPLPRVVSVNTFWSRMTEEEAEDFDSAMMSKPIRIRKMYQSEQNNYTEGSELFTVIEGELILLFGQTRSDELLS